jgi:hypothetical protein
MPSKRLIFYVLIWLYVSVFSWSEQSRVRQRKPITVIVDSHLLSRLNEGHIKESTTTSTNISNEVNGRELLDQNLQTKILNLTLLCKMCGIGEIATCKFL